MLAFLIDQPFDGKEWLFETKWDGYRAIADVQPTKVELYSRHFLSFNERFKPLIEPLQQLGVEAILDGEIVVLDEKGKSSFQSLQNYQRTGKGNLFYCIFDFLFFEGHDLRNLPLLTRKKLLKKLIPNSKKSPLHYSKHVLTKGIEAFHLAEQEGEEGIIAKNILSPYVSCRSRYWLKIKTHARQEAIICGFTQPRGSRQAFGSLILGVHINNQLQYAGHVGGGFDDAMLNHIKKLLAPLETSKCPFKSIPKTNMPVTWIKPKLICEVSFQEWTSDQRMRHPIFKGLRTDKKVSEVKKENPLIVRDKTMKPKKTSGDEEPNLTHLDKVYWPKQGYTKGMLIEYYREISDYILPYLKDRPESLHRFPNGIDKPGFFQKRITEAFPDWLPTCLVEHQGEPRPYMMIQDKKTLLYAINLGCIDLHPFSSRMNSLNYPDYIIFDLDPEDIPFDVVRQTALVLHEVLDEYAVPNFCKTSGGTGLHIFVPTGSKYLYDQVRLFAELFSHIVHEILPDTTSLERSPNKRQKKVYLDYLQNRMGQTIAAPYCVRPYPFAPVSTPLEWSEVKKPFHPADFTIKNTLNRLKKKGDIFKAVLNNGFNLTKVLNAIKKRIESKKG